MGLSCYSTVASGAATGYVHHAPCRYEIPETWPTSIAGKGTSFRIRGSNGLCCEDDQIPHGAGALS